MSLHLLHWTHPPPEPAPWMYRAQPAFLGCAPGIIIWATSQCRKSMGFVVRRPSTEAGLCPLAAQRTRTPVLQFHPPAFGLMALAHEIPLEDPASQPASLSL